MSNKKRARNGGIAAVVIAMVTFLLLLGSGLWWHSVYTFSQEADSAPGEVVEMVASRGSDSTTYAPRFRFQDGRGDWYTITSRSSSNPPAFHVGEKVEVLYRQGEPYEAKINSFTGLWLGPTIISAIAAVFLLISLATGFVSWRKSKNNTRLLSHGRPLMALYQRVEREKVDDDGYSLFYIVARWHDKASNELQLYRSEPLDFDPSDFLSDGQHITVLVNKQDPAVYMMDLSFLPERTV